jgi:spore maturation protein CgeB
MKIIYSFNKVGVEARQWTDEILASSGDGFEFIPFNHGEFLNPSEYLEAWQLDRLYRSRNYGLTRMYSAFNALVEQRGAAAVVVNNCPPFHPEFLREHNLYKVLYSSDDPDATYRRNIPYLHAYDHVMYLDPAHSAEIDMKEKCSTVEWLTRISCLTESWRVTTSRNGPKKISSRKFAI